MSRKRTGTIPYPLVTVKWVDAWALSRWSDVKDFKRDRGSSCRTTGYLIEENKHSLVLASTLSWRGSANEFDCNAVMCIPKGWVQGKPVPVG